MGQGQRGEQGREDGMQIMHRQPAVSMDSTDNVKSVHRSREICEQTVAQDGSEGEQMMGTGDEMMGTGMR